ncbi:MAG: 6,7-dimethyl-8-ribityllumazine synthase [Acidobacteria bacterium RIFCSPLOWO2_12_FULL_67_14]|nr:MAG: 6,7-dimethyl-8-ribityllumazine synthase [Acidobacteria bacterium RIFCSPLOWO2_02_FULL_67_21]OFW35826.1 MAG: 6,7-dimethyl-8-ribityllumazine synthase [Acidobacteria bacterium RIFCSPLOWO2_12_FULL_67_14]
MELQGSRTAPGCRFAIVVSHFHEEIGEGLLRGARQALSDAQVSDGDITVLHVPGAFEIPVAALQAARTRNFDAVICIGCLIKGDTMHFEYIATAACSGIAEAALSTGVPIALGVLTALTEEQARERAADGPGNKGREAALAAIEMATLFRRMQKERAE